MLELKTVFPLHVLLAEGNARMFTMSIIVFNLWRNNDREATDNMETGISVGDHIINTIRYAYDKAYLILANSQKGLQQLMDNLNKVTIEFGMKINVKWNRSGAELRWQRKYFFWRKRDCLHLQVKWMWN